MASKIVLDSIQSVHDLEVKDEQIIFNSVWSALEKEIGEENLYFPKEIFWLKTTRFFLPLLKFPAYF